MRERRLWGLLAEFTAPEALVEAARRARAAGYSRMDAHTPFPVEGLPEALGFRRSGVPFLSLAGGVAGGLAAYGLQYYLTAVDYPLDVGGRPLHSALSFMVVTFELTILGAALAAVLGMLALNGLPRLHHPIFNVDRFALASRDRFFLVVSSSDPAFHRDRTEEFLRSVHPVEVSAIDDDAP